MIHEDQVSRKQLAPLFQEPSGSVPDTTVKPKEQTGGKGAFVSVRGVKVPGPGGRGRISRRGECQHQRGGYCLLHGGAATKLFRTVTKTTSGRGGKPIQKVSRQTYYVCNEENTTEESLRQTQLSFTDARRTTIPA